ncbi:hypothetical protein CANARDRAFT_181022, partial [[Candida] arabinofermentans NRRL YB-2248]
IRKFDSSSYLLSKFFPPNVRDSFIFIKSFNIELSKLSTGYQASSPSKSRTQNKQFNNFKFQFWNEQIDNCFTGQRMGRRLAGDPVTTLLNDLLDKGIQLDLGMLKQMIISHQTFFKEHSQHGFQTVEDMCSFGEGTYSQINYILQSALLSPSLSPFPDTAIRLLESSGESPVKELISDIAAHLGQATSISSFLIGLRYHASARGVLMLPEDSVSKNGSSQESIIRFLSGEDDGNTRELVKNIVFEVATIANDHILTARSKIDQLKKTEIPQLLKMIGDRKLEQDWSALNNGLPDSLFLPFMNGIPAIIFLEKLEKNDFDITSPSIQVKDWRLAWRCYRSFNTR